VSTLAVGDPAIVCFPPWERRKLKVWERSSKARSESGGLYINRCTTTGYRIANSAKPPVSGGVARVRRLRNRYPVSGKPIRICIHRPDHFHSGNRNRFLPKNGNRLQRSGGPDELGSSTEGLSEETPPTQPRRTHGSSSAPPAPSPRGRCGRCGTSGAPLLS